MTVINDQKLTGNNLILDLVNMNAYIKFGEILSFFFLLRYWAEMENVTAIKGQNCYKFATNDR